MKHLPSQLRRDGVLVDTFPLGAKKGGVMKKPAAVGKAASGGKAKLPDGVARFKEEADKVRVH